MAMSREEIMADPDTSHRLAAYWLTQIQSVDETNARWHKRGDKIIKRYKDERDQAAEEGTRRLNVLWSNVQILQPAIYGRRPQPVAERRFLDHDPIGRLSAQMIERALRNEIEENGYHSAMRRAVKDYLLPGRGQCWVRYEPEIGPGDSLIPSSPIDMTDAQGEILDGEPEDEAGEKLEETGEQVIFESCPVDYIQYKDFYMFPSRARTWDEVTAVGKKVYLSKGECIERFGEDVGSNIKEDTAFSVAERMAAFSINTFQDQNERKRVVYEIWNKADRRVYWVSTGYDRLCDIMDDPLGLRGFFPCPEPLSTTLANDSMIPVPDYIEYQDQAIQIDELTQRIALLTKACKVAGVYDGANRPLKRLLDESVENELIPVDDWARYGDKGGVAGAISFLPLKEIMETLDVLMTVKEKMLQDLDRVTGISDVLRGTTDGRETMGGTRLKTNNAGTRINNRRDEVARFARDIIRIVAEIISEHYSAKSLIEISGVLYEEEFAPIQKLQDLISELAAENPGASLSRGSFGAGALPPLVGAPAAPGGLGAGPAPQPPALGASLPPGPGGLLAPPGVAMGGPPPGMGGMRPPMAAGAPPSMGPGGPPSGGAPTEPQPEPPPLVRIMALREPVERLMSRLGKAITLLRRDIPRGFRIDIEVDSTIAGDAAEERQDAIEFLGAMAKFLETGAMIGAQQPAMVPLMGKMLQFGVRKFRTGRALESSIDDFVDQADRRAKEARANPQTKPSIEELQIQAIEARAKADIVKSKIEAETGVANEMRDRERLAMEHQARMEQLQIEREVRREEHAMKIQEIQASRIAKEIAHRQEQARATDPTAPNVETIKAHSMAAKANAEITKAQLEAQGALHAHRLDQQRSILEHEARILEMTLHHEMKRAEHQARIQHLEHEQAGAREEHLFKIDHLEHQRATLREKAAHERRKSKAEPLMEQHKASVEALAQLAEKIHKAASLKRRVVRGPDGLISGIEPDDSEAQAPVAPQPETAVA
jgi:hypothetical protein